MGEMVRSEAEDERRQNSKGEVSSLHICHLIITSVSLKRRRSLRRRFEQNQEDCTYTVLALLPTFRDEIIAALPAEDITAELQKQKQDRLAKSAGPSEAASSEFPSAPASTINDDDRGSLNSFQSGSYIHASQMTDSGESGSMRPRKSKIQLWNDLKITCESCVNMVRSHQSC